jgi:hypothetical protein
MNIAISPGEKYCPKCKSVRLKSEFQNNITAPEGIEPWCRECKNKDYISRRDKRKAEGLCHCGRKVETGKTCETCKARCRNWIKDNKEYLLIRRKEDTKIKREKILNAYGNRCICCDETIQAFLELDHIEGGGNAHRRKILKEEGKQFYDWIIKNNYPSGFQLLCSNCNACKWRYGKCAHELMKPVEIAK